MTLGAASFALAAGRPRPCGGGEGEGRGAGKALHPGGLFEGVSKQEGDPGQGGQVQPARGQGEGPARLLHANGAPRNPVTRSWSGSSPLGSRATAATARRLRCCASLSRVAELRPPSEPSPSAPPAEPLPRVRVWSAQVSVDIVNALDEFFGKYSTFCEIYFHFVAELRPHFERLRTVFEVRAQRSKSALRALAFAPSARPNSSFAPPSSPSARPNPFRPPRCGARVLCSSLRASELTIFSAPPN
eukprot:703720-Prorocentrum_minimum.AAC.3